MISAILRQSLDLYRRFSGRFIATAAVVFVVMDLLAALSSLASRRGSPGAAAFWGLLSFLASLVGTFWVQGAIVEAVRDVRDGRIDTTIPQLFERTRPRLAALIAAGLLAGFGIALGFVFLIIPGLYLLTRWILIVPVIVLEGKSAGESFGRSNGLVRGYGWDVFGLVLITLIAGGIAQGILVLLFAWLPSFFGVWIGNLIAHSLVVPYILIAWTLLYHRLIELHAATRLPTGPTPARPSPPTTPPLTPPTPTTP